MSSDEFTAANNIEEVYLKYVAPIRAYLFHLSGDRELAADLVQEVFYRATRALMAGRRIDYVSSWLYRIARNLYLDHATRCKTNYELSYDDASTFRAAAVQDDVSLALERHDLQRKIQCTLKLLPEKQLTVLLLRDYHGLSYTEVAAVMRISVSAVKSLLFRARLNFQTHFQGLTAKEGE